MAGIRVLKLFLLTAGSLLFLSFPAAAQIDPISFAKSDRHKFELCVFGEPDISAPRSGVLQSWRLIVWPYLAPPLSFRIDKKANGTSLITKQLDHAGGEDPTKVSIERTVAITSTQLTEFTRMLNAIKFIDAPTKDPTYMTDGRVGGRLCFDAASWTLEGHAGKYHVIERICPQEREVHEIGFYLLKLSGLKVNQKDLF